MNKRLYEVSFFVTILPDGFDYPAQIVILADDKESAQEEARQWFRREQPYHRPDNDHLIGSTDRFKVAEVESFICYAVDDKPVQWKMPRPKVVNFK